MSDLATMHGTAMADAQRGDALAWSDKTRAALHAFGLPRELQKSFALQPRPRTVVRELTKHILSVCDAERRERSPRRLLYGEPGCGKSTYLLQAVAHAVECDWALLYIPQSIRLINSSSPYTYSAAFATYLQPELVTRLLEGLLAVNAAALKRIEASDVSVEGVRVRGGPLDKVIEGALRGGDAHVRQLAFEHAVRTLMTQDTVPFLVAIDDVQAFFMPTRYRDPDFRALEAFELAVPRAILELVLTGEARHGTVLTALSSAHADYPASAELLLALRERAEWPRLLAALSTRSSPTRVTEPNAYAAVHATRLAMAKSAAFEPVDVGQQLARSEAAAVLDLLYRERAIWTQPNDEVFMAKLVESRGNVHTFAHSWRSTLS